jgi:hypothetical protein
MAGFEWLPRQLPTNPLPGDAWCVRDAFCQLLGWSEGSVEWSRFIEARCLADMPRLIDELGLESYDPDYAPHAAELVKKLDHPGIVAYNLTYPDPLDPSGFGHVSHVMYEPDLRHLRGLPLGYQAFMPERFNVIVDTRQSADTAPGSR